MTKEVVIDQAIRKRSGKHKIFIQIDEQMAKLKGALHLPLAKNKRDLAKKKIECTKRLENYQDRKKLNRGKEKKDFSLRGTIEACEQEMIRHQK